MQEATRTRQEQLVEEEERGREEQAQGKTSRHMNTTSSKQVSEHCTRGGSKNNHKTQTHKLALKTYTASHTLNVTILVAL